jgi:anaerobic selenocysteine-containing dehydrogenase
MSIGDSHWSKNEEIWEDKWIDTTCGGCYCGCAARVRRVNGVAIAIEGNADTSQGGRGGICAKGVAGLMLLYDPNRLNVPLKRTNPEKGVGVDPKWEEISWEEALSEIAERLKKIREDNPNKFWQNTATGHAYGGWGLVARDWVGAFGSHQRLASGGSLHCGNGAHHTAGLVHAAWSSTVDWRYNKYAIKWGSSKGTGSGHSVMINARLRAEAISRGAKEVSFDPMCNFAAGHAKEWIPLLPGTDSAVALAMANVMINDLRIYDAPFLKKKTNLSFLTDPEGHFVRDEDGIEPLVWDIKSNQAKKHNDPSVGVEDYALEGVFEVRGVKCQPAFILLKEHLKKHTPEWAEKISTVPAETIRRIATEFAETASVGSTIMIEGKSYPYRPVGSIFFRGSQGHTNGTHQCWTLDFLNIIVGAEDVPGGCLGWPAIRMGHPDTGHVNMVPRVGKDGVIIPANFIGGHDPWPIKMPSDTCSGGRCDDFWTMTTTSGVPHMKDREEIWKKLNMTTEPELLILWGGNLAISVANWEDQVNLAKKIPFIVMMDIFSNETAESLADILLPDQCYLERMDWQTNLLSYFFNHAPTTEEWAYHPQLPVIEEQIGQRRNCIEVMRELTDRVGFRDKWNAHFNRIFHITDPGYQLKPDEKLTWAEMGDRILQWCFGPDKGLEYFKENGYITWPKKVEEVYWRWNWESLKNVRIPVYREHLIDIGDKAREIGQKVNLDLDFDQYTPFPSYFKPQSHHEVDEEYDLFAFSYRDTLHTNNVTQENPWLDEVSQLSPYTYTITMNVDKARQKGLKDGDTICLETPYGRKTEGVLKVMEGQHPKTVAIAGQAGLWAKGRPIAYGKGSNFTTLMESDLKHYDPLTLCIETAVGVKVYKA